MKISLICSTRNNLRYLKYSYASVLKFKAAHEVEWCVYDDFSDDGTLDWCMEIAKIDQNFKWLRNPGPARVGHTIGYDQAVLHLATNDICMIWHADGEFCENCLDGIEKYMAPKTIVSLTRIEPDTLHIPGVEKIRTTLPHYPEDLDRSKFYMWYNDNFSQKTGKISNGVFFPWAFNKSEFLEIGGHDKILAPQSFEDSSIWNRFKLYGINFIQTFDYHVLHWCSRGSRFADNLTSPGKDSEEWAEQRDKSARNFIRLWGSMVIHDQYLHPIVPHRYHIGIVINNCTLDFLGKIEPWGYKIYTAMDPDVIAQYIQNEDTTFDLAGKIHNISTAQVHDNLHDVMIYIDRNTFNNTDYQNLTHISFILAESGQPGSEMVLGNMRFKINALTPHELDLVHI